MLHFSISQLSNRHGLKSRVRRGVLFFITLGINRRFNAVYTVLCTGAFSGT